MDKKHLWIKTKREIRKVELDQVVYIEKELSKVNLFMLEEHYTFYSNMQKVKQQTDERFMDCHRSYLFNMDHIVCMTNQSIYLSGGYQITLGRESYRKGKRQFHQYLEGKTT